MTATQGVLCEPEVRSSRLSMEPSSPLNQARGNRPLVLKFPPRRTAMVSGSQLATTAGGSSWLQPTIQKSSHWRT